MADPGWVLARERGKKPRDFKCNSNTGPNHLPGTWIRLVGSASSGATLKGTGAGN